MNKTRYRVSKGSDDLWVVEYRWGIWTTAVTFDSFEAAQEYIRYRIYGKQDDYGKAS